MSRLAAIPSRKYHPAISEGKLVQFATGAPAFGAEWGPLPVAPFHAVADEGDGPAGRFGETGGKLLAYIGIQGKGG